MTNFIRIRKFSRNHNLRIGGTFITHAPEGTSIDIDLASVRRDLLRHEDDYDTVSVSGSDATLVAESLTAHQIDTTAIHGITDTSTLATAATISAAVTAHEVDTTSIHGIANTALLATTASVAAAVAAHETDQVSVHGIADTSLVVLTADSRLTDTRTPTDQSVTNAKVAPNAAIAVTKLAPGTDGQVLRVTAGAPAWGAPSATGDPPMGGDLTGVASNAQLGVGVVGSAEISDVIKDPIAGTPALRTLGTGALQAAAGNHIHATYATTASFNAHEIDTTSVHGIADTAALITLTQLTAHEVDALSVHGIVDTAQLATISAVSSSINTHSIDTTGVHGIADTSLLLTTANIDATVDARIATHASDTTAIHGIADTSLILTQATLDAHAADTTAIHGIADTTLLTTTTALTAHAVDTTAIHGIADTSLLLTSVDMNAHSADATEVHGISNTAQLITKTQTNTGTAHALELTQSGDTGTSTTTGGAFRFINTANNGLGLLVYSNHATPLGRLVTINAANAAFNQSALRIEHAGSGRGLDINQTGSGIGANIAAAGGATASAHALAVSLTGTGSATASALSVSSANTAHSALQVTGVESDRGSIKVTHTGTGADVNASGLSIDLQGAGTAAQGIFLDATGGGTIGKLLNIRNNGVDRLVLTSAGSLQLAASTTVTIGAADIREEVATFTRTGALTVGAGTGSFPFPYAATIISVTARVTTAPTGASLILDVNKNGTTIFSTQGNRPTITASTNATSSSPTPNTTGMVSGDYLTVDVDQIGSTIAGSDVTVQVLYKRT